MRSSGSMMLFATIPACMAVPQATIWIWEQERKRESGISSSERSGSPLLILGSTVSFMASGCSWISFSMKWGKPFFMAASMFQLIVIISGCVFEKSSRR